MTLKIPNMYSLVYSYVLCFFYLSVHSSVSCSSVLSFGWCTDICLRSFLAFFIATMVGSSRDCENMLNTVNGVMERVWEKVVDNGIHCATQIASNYIGWWETCSTPYLFQWCPQYLFQGCTVMVGWDASDCPYVYNVNRHGVQCKTKSKCCKRICEWKQSL